MLDIKEIKIFNWPHTFYCTACSKENPIINICNSEKNKHNVWKDLCPYCAINTIISIRRKINENRNKKNSDR